MTKPEAKPKVKKKVGSSKPPKASKGSGKGRKPVSKAAKKKKPKGKNDKTTRPPKITAEKYNALQEAYFIKQSIEGAGKVAKVTRKTARFYIEGPGKPEVGLVPIKQLWLDVQMEAQEKRQMTLMRFHQEQLKELEEILNTSLGELKLIRAATMRRIQRFKDSGGTDIETASSLGAALKSYERVARLMERFLGAPDATLTHRTEDRYRNWSDEEIVEFMTTGKVPDHAR